MKTKTAKQPKQSKPAVRLKDIKPKNDAKGGRGTGKVPNSTDSFYGSGVYK